MILKDLLKLSKIKQLEFYPFDLKNKNEKKGGIYKFYDSAGEIIYVGKSSNLHRRILQHLGHDTNSKEFIDDVAYIEYLEEPSPIMQTLLEGIFIAFHTPKHNDEVKDEKRSREEDGK